MQAVAERRTATTDLILVAGADPAHWPLVRAALDGAWTPAFAVELRGIFDVMARDRPAMLLLCSDLLDVSARVCLERVRELYPRLPVLVVEGRDLRKDAAHASERNVMYLAEQAVAEQLSDAVKRLLGARRRRVTDTESLESPANRPMVMGKSSAMRKVLETIYRVARVNVTVLLFGETGCGKELLARRLHCASDRAAGPFRAVSLPAVPKELFESIVFGHERGAFTGAVTQSTGAFAQAQGGTLFLDEVSSLALESQPKLLRAIQEREIERVGARAPTRCDVRIVAATNVDLRDAVASGAFREDLYHRLSVVAIEIPPLRERPEDVPPLVEFFLSKYAREFRRELPDVSSDAMQALSRHRWSGNVREVENRVQKALLLSDKSSLCADDFFGESREARPAPGVCFGRYDYSLAEIEQAYIEQVVARTDGNQSRAAEILSIDRKTLRAKLNKSATRFGYMRAVPGAERVDSCAK